MALVFSVNQVSSLFHPGSLYVSSSVHLNDTMCMFGTFFSQEESLQIQDEEVWYCKELYIVITLETERS